MQPLEPYSSIVDNLELFKMIELKVRLRPVLKSNSARVGKLSANPFLACLEDASCRSTPARHAANPYPKKSHPMLNSNSKHSLNL